MRSRALRWAAILALPIGALAGYSVLYFAWLTATPLTAEGLRRAQYDVYCWFAIFALCILIILTYGVGLISKRNKRTTQDRQP